MAKKEEIESGLEMLLDPVPLFHFFFFFALYIIVVVLVLGFIRTRSI